MNNKGVINVSERYLTVTALTRYIKRKFELDQHLTTVWLKAEISNFKLHSRGHMYFTLKDDQSRILAVMFAGYNRSLRFQPEDGMHVIVKGEVSVYEAAGQYQLYVHDMIPDGVGALHLAFEQLKQKLSNEGLFDETRKKSIPSFPEHIGIITSPTGAAIKDILSTINRRFPIVKISVFPALVQGEQAKFDLVNKINQANQMESIDTLIVGRGGGSIEELWPFNEEIVARAIANSRIPIISAVGHETDTTIADFVADLRAATPTAAAELAVPNLVDLIDRTNNLKRVLHNQFSTIINKKHEQLNKLKSSTAFQYPKQLIFQKEQELDRLVERLEKNTTQLIQNKKDIYQETRTRFKLNNPEHQLKSYQQKMNFLRQNLHNHFQKQFDHKVTQFDRYLNKLTLLSPLHTMKRGYSIGYDQSGNIIKSVNHVELGDRMTLRLADGTIESEITHIEENSND